MCSAAAALTVLSGVQLTSTAADSEPSKYSDMNNWAYFAEGDDKDVDVFFIAPTVDTKDEAKMDINDEKNR